MGYHNNDADYLASISKPVAIFGDHTCKMQLLIEPFSIGPNVVPFVPEGELPAVYVFHVLDGLVKTQEYKRHWTTLNSKEVLIAKPEVAAKYQILIEPLLLQGNVLKKKVYNLRHTRDLLLPRLLSGQIDLSQTEKVEADAA